jgi:hypothetical protein
VVKQAWPQIGIVVTSGRMAPGPKDLPSGALFMPKPYRPADLLAAVRTVLPSDRSEIPAEAQLQCCLPPSRSVSSTPALVLLAVLHSPFASPKNSLYGA